MFVTLMSLKYAPQIRCRDFCRCINLYVYVFYVCTLCRQVDDHVGILVTQLSD